MFKKGEGMSAQWVKSGLPPRAGALPAWVVLPLPFQIFNITSPAMWAVTLFALGLGIFLQSKGRTLLWVMRRGRSRLRGYSVQARPIGYRRATTMDVSVDEFDFDKWRAQ